MIVGTVRLAMLTARVFYTQDSRRETLALARAFCAGISSKERGVEGNFVGLGFMGLGF